MAALISRTVVTVTYGRCGSQHLIPMRVRTLVSTRRELHVRVTTPPATEAWARLFAEAHAGPLRYSRTPA